MPFALRSPLCGCLLIEERVSGGVHERLRAGKPPAILTGEVAGTQLHQQDVGIVQLCDNTRIEQKMDFVSVTKSGVGGFPPFDLEHNPCVQGLPYQEEFAAEHELNQLIILSTPCGSALVESQHSIFLKHN